MKIIYATVPAVIIAVFTSAHVQAEFDPCVEERINAHRAEAGPDAMIRMDVIGEWEEECGIHNSLHDDQLVLETEESVMPFQNHNPDFRLAAKPVWNEVFNFWMETIEFQATENNVTVHDVTINRGNCRINEERLPVRLNFGQTHWLVISCPASSVIEASVTSDRGSWTFTFDQ